MHIKVRISKIRGVPSTVTVDGAKGSACLTKTLAIRKAVGAGAVARTDDFYKSEEVSVAVTG